MDLDFSDLAYKTAANLEAHESYSDFKYGKSMALAMATVAAFAHPHSIISRHPTTIQQTTSTYSTITVETDTSESALLGVMHHIMKNLMKDQKDLDMEAKAVLFRNRKDLYY